MPIQKFIMNMQVDSVTSSATQSGIAFTCMKPCTLVGYKYKWISRQDTELSGQIRVSWMLYHRRDGNTLHEIQEPNQIPTFLDTLVTGSTAAVIASGIMAGERELYHIDTQTSYVYGRDQGAEKTSFKLSLGDEIRFTWRSESLLTTQIMGQLTFWINF